MIKVRLISVVIVIFMFSLILYACSSMPVGMRIQKEEKAEVKKKAGKLDVCVTVPVFEEFVREIGKDEVNVTVLLPVGENPHNWVPGEDIYNRINRADVFIYNGANLEKWIDDAFKNKIDSKTLVVCEFSRSLPLFDKRRMAKKDSPNINERKLTLFENNKSEYDPHVWMSPKLVKYQLQGIKTSLAHKNLENFDYYTQNANNYVERLSVLDAWITDKLKNLQGKEFLVDSDAFNYFAMDYNIVIKEDNKASSMNLDTMEHFTSSDVTISSRYIDAMKSNLEKILK